MRMDTYLRKVLRVEKILIFIFGGGVGTPIRQDPWSRRVEDHQTKLVLSSHKLSYVLQNHFFQREESERDTKSPVCGE